MKKTVITKNHVEGFHNYPDAPKDVSFLAHNHRHVFHVECGFEVSHGNREIEIFNMQFQIDEYFAHLYGVPAKFCAMSCEMIAEKMLCDFAHHNCVYVKVTEDGEGGAIVQR